MKTFVSILLYGCFVSAPTGMLVILISFLYGKLTGRPPSSFVDDVQPIDIVFLLGMLIAVIGVALGFFGLVLALVFVAPTLSELIKFISGLL